MDRILRVRFRPSPWLSFARWACVLAAAAMTSGCDLGLDVAVDVGRDGGGRVAVAVSADDELLDEAQRAGARPLDRLAERASELPGWSVDDTVEGDVRTVRLSAPFTDSDELRGLTSQLADALNADEVALLQPLSLEVGEDDLQLRGSAGLEPTRVVRDYGLSPRQVVRRLRRTDVFTYTVSATFPGDVVDAPGATVDGRTATWIIEPGESVQINATAHRPAPSLLPLILSAVGGGALAGAAVWWWRRRRGA